MSKKQKVHYSKQQHREYAAAKRGPQRTQAPEVVEENKKWKSLNKPKHKHKIYED